MLRANRFEVIDLGADVATSRFVEKVKELKPDVLGLSALLTTTMLRQKEVVEALRHAGVRDRVKVVVGGVPVTDEWVEEVDADASGKDAIDAVQKIKKLVQERPSS